MIASEVIGDMTLPSVDVIIAVWNRADTIERAIQSALAQPEVRRVIVVDDESTDDTALRAEGLAKKTNRVVVRRLPSNSGPSKARNIALETSDAQWVAMLDGDDWFLPARMRALLAYADDHDFIADDLLQMSEGQAEVGHQCCPAMFDYGSGPYRLTLEDFVLGNIGRRGTQRKELGFLKPLIRRSFLDRNGLRYDETLRLGEDYLLYAHALACGARFVLVPVQSYVSVIRQDSISGHHTQQDLERLRDANLELGRISVLTTRERLALRKHYRSVDARVQWLAVIEAVKARSPARFVLPFCRSPQVSLSLTRQLAGQLWQRSIRGRAT
jgi:succinoglycan biosynthesis protein ExoU